MMKSNIIARIGLLKPRPYPAAIKPSFPSPHANSDRLPRYGFRRFAAAVAAITVSFSGIMSLGGIMFLAEARAADIILDCGSHDADMIRHCALPDDVSMVSLARNKTNLPCVFGKSWGLEGDMLWTSRGCLGEFVVRTTSDEHLHDEDRILIDEKGQRRRRGYGRKNGVFWREV